MGGCFFTALGLCSCPFLYWGFGSILLVRFFVRIFGIFRLHFSSFLGFGFIFTPPIFLLTGWRSSHLYDGVFLASSWTALVSVRSYFTLASRCFPFPVEREGVYSIALASISFFDLYLGKLSLFFAGPSCLSKGLEREGGEYIYFLSR